MIGTRRLGPTFSSGDLGFSSSTSFASSSVLYAAF